MKDYEIKFEKVSFTGKTEKSSKGSGADGYWSFDQVQKGQHLKNFEKMTDREIEQVAGKEDNPVAYTSEGGGAMLRNDSLKRMPGFEGNINLAKSGAVAGNITGKFNPNPKIFEPHRQYLYQYIYNGWSGFWRVYEKENKRWWQP